jgi:hypothetical protein
MLTIPWNSAKGWGEPVIRPCASASLFLSLLSALCPRSVRLGRYTTRVSAADGALCDLLLFDGQTDLSRSTLRRPSFTTPSLCAPLLSTSKDLRIRLLARAETSYLICSFEGMKAYRCDDGTVRLFRPDKNMARMNTVRPLVLQRVLHHINS